MNFRPVTYAAPFVGFMLVFLPARVLFNKRLRPTVSGAIMRRRG